MCLSMLICFEDPRAETGELAEPICLWFIVPDFKRSEETASLYTAYIYKKNLARELGLDIPTLTDALGLPKDYSEETYSYPVIQKNISKIFDIIVPDLRVNEEKLKEAKDDTLREIQILTDVVEATKHDTWGNLYQTASAKLLKLIAQL